MIEEKIKQIEKNQNNLKTGITKINDELLKTGELYKEIAREIEEGKQIKKEETVLKGKVEEYKKLIDGYREEVKEMREEREKIKNDKKMLEIEKESLRNKKVELDLFEKDLTQKYEQIKKILK